MNNIINISSDNIAGKCDYKCSYTYDYLDTTLVANNNSNMISLINNGIDPVVTYNNNNYMVSSTMIVSPSLHKYNNNKTDGEILIEHMPIQGGKKMYVCIPITQSTDFSSASVTIGLIIAAVQASAPDTDNSVAINTGNFNLNSFIPEGPFYSYVGYDLNNNVSDFVAFGIEDAIPLNQSIFSTLTEIIQPISVKMKGGNLFFNENGPNSSTTTPDTNVLDTNVLDTNVLDTNVLDTNVLDTNGDSTSSPFIDNEMISSIIQIILNCLFFFALFYIINFLFNYLLSGVNPKIYSIT